MSTGNERLRSFLAILVDNLERKIPSNETQKFAIQRMLDRCSKKARIDNPETTSVAISGFLAITSWLVIASCLFRLRLKEMLSISFELRWRGLHLTTQLPLSVIFICLCYLIYGNSDLVHHMVYQVLISVEKSLRQ